MHKIISYSFVKFPLKPFLNEYFVAIVENNKDKVFVQIDKKYKDIVKIGMKGEIKKKKISGKIIFDFIPNIVNQEKEKIKIVLITGSTRGIGKAIAFELAKKGMIIVLNSKNNNKIALRTISEIKKISPNSSYFCYDVSDEKQVNTLISKVIKKYKRVDVLINNAGIMEGKGVANMDLELWERILDTDLNSVFLCCKGVIPCMKNIGGGKIINLTSISGQIGYAGQAHYSAAKAGIIGFTKSLAKELAQENILVNAIAPGFINTDILKAIPKSILEEYIKNIPLKRLGEPEEVAKLAAFLVSEDSSYITGQVFNINGGLYM